jgi:protein TonB
MVAGVAALLLHLTVLAVLLFVPGRALRDDDASQPVMVTLVTEPPMAQVPPVAAPLAEPPPPETAPALDNPPPPPEAPPTPDVPPPPPAPDTSPPRVPAPIAKPKTPLLRLTVPAHPVAPPSSATPAEPRPPASAAPRADIIGPYRNSLAAHVQTYQRYPALARTRREEGLVVLHVIIQRDGQIAAMSIEHGSGSEVLDREALATLKRADPLPPIPAGVPGATIDLEFPLRFHLE